MSGFSAHLDDLDRTIDDELRDAGFLRPLTGGPDLPIRVALERPSEVERLLGGGVVQARAFVEISLLLAPSLRPKDVVLIGEAAPFDGWRIAAPPLRPGDGRHWRAEVEPLGPVAA